ncbi:MAG TPA: tail fiber domain-containing protein [Chthoniobacterales bacterium]
MTNTTRLTKTVPCMGHRSRSPHRLLPGLSTLGIGLFLLVTGAFAVTPPPDGGYPNHNTAEGDSALFNLNTSVGLSNTAMGSQALFSDTTGSFNTAVGDIALTSNTIGAFNTAVGDSALELNTTGLNNTAVGSFALDHNTTGGQNTALGDEALDLNTTGMENTATGNVALSFNSTGSFNTADGDQSLVNNTRGNSNTGTGQAALMNNSSGNNNVADGAFALGNNTTGSGNIAIGTTAGSELTTGKNNIDIGNSGVARESGIIRIGSSSQRNTFIAGISGVTVAGGVSVMVDPSGHLGTLTSSARFKQAIKPMGETSEAIFSLRPVSFRYKNELDPAGIPQFGLVAEDVAKVAPDLVARDQEGKPYSVRYEAVNAMLLNEFLKEHREVTQQSALLEKQEAEIAALRAGLKEQSVQLQKVTNELATSYKATRLVTNQ